MLECVTARSVNWTILAAPNAGWATQVFGTPDVEALWEAVARATRLDEPDLVGAWRAHTSRLQARADGLNAHGFDAVRFRGPGTELTIGLIPGARWLSARSETAAGIEHVPNIPTEEVFTSPDWRRAEGRIRSTKPLVTSGTTVSELEVRFEAGRIVEVNAARGADIIREQLATDDQAGYLGEVALVDGSSPVNETGLVFCDTLFDENATCHIAFGSGIPEALRGGGGTRGLARTRRERLGRAHGLHGRWARRRGRRPRRGRLGDADHSRRRLAARVGALRPSKTAQRSRGVTATSV